MDIFGFIVLFSIISVLLLLPLLGLMQVKEKLRRQRMEERLKSINKQVVLRSTSKLRGNKSSKYNISLGKIVFFIFLPIPPLFVVLTSSSILSAVMSITLYFGFVGMFYMFLMRMRRRRYIKNFVLLLPNSIDLIIRSLRAGRTITDSIKTVGLETKGPVAEQFVTIIDQVELGKDFVSVVNDVSKKLNIAEFSFFVIVLSVQQETGGNIIKTLSSLANMLRQRQMMRMKIKALSAEGIFSAFFMGGLPFFVIGIIELIRPEYLTPLFYSSTGHKMLIYAVVSEFIGCMIIFRMVRIDI